MKKITILFVAVSFLFVNCDANKKSASPETGELSESDEPQEEKLPPTTVSFSEEEFNFGDIKDGDKVSHIFKITNTGENPLVIKSAIGSCGCTVPKYSNEPIAPGESGEINVEFDSSNKPGMNEKMVTVVANTEQQMHILKIKANVLAK